MGEEELQAAIDGITSTVNQLHPDIQVVLLTYSSRIGVYKVGPNTSVQYIHMATNNGAKDIFEGRDCNNFTNCNDNNNSNNNNSNNSDNSNTNTTNISNISITCPLSYIANFRDVAMDIKTCREVSIYIYIYIHLSIQFFINLTAIYLSIYLSSLL
jgi:hypothetical protein